MAKTLPTVFLWSHPRALSTAFYRAFESAGGEGWATTLPEKVLVDRVGAMEGGSDLIFREIVEQSTQKGPLLFNEHLGHCLIGDFLSLPRDIDTLQKGKHVFIFRDPEKSIPSLAKTWYLANEKDKDHTKPDTKAFEAWGLSGASPLQKLRILRGYEAMAKFILDFERNMGYRPVVIDADILLEHPQKTFDFICDKLSLPFEGKDMMTWEGKMKNVDPALEMWFETANNSNGFIAKNPATKEEIRIKGKQYLSVVPEEWREGAYECIEECREAYGKLRGLAVTKEELGVE